ncbi:unnamed protein product [Spirodela intermedia]|uniref:Uncharacterized protein n=1 Tax=Spirodela intermedia TaxID=51605 RepID=A0A7I8JXQ8_SPIIN|nr:unnamed protein product [Spirodela intermedia]
MAKAGQSHHLGADLIQVVEQLERHCLAPDGSYVSKSAYSDLQLAREEMSRERTRYLESLTLYIEAIAMVEEYQQSLASANVGGTREAQGHHPRLLGMMCTPQVYESLDHRLVVAEAAQRLRLPLVSKDGDIHEEEIEKLITMSRGSSDTTGAKVNSASNSTGYANITNISSGLPNTVIQSNISNLPEPGVGGVPNHFLGITSDFLWKVQLQKAPISLDETHYQRSISSEMEGRLEAKCDKLADIFATVEIDSSSLSHIPNARLPERVKLITEEIEREETFLLQDLYSMDRKFAEHYSVLEQILSVLVKFVKDLKLQHQHKLDELRKDWLCKRCQTLNAKLRCLEYLLLCSTYNKDSVPALHRVREHLVEAKAEASVAYNKAVTRLREYQGVDPHFDAIAMEYHDIVKKLEGMQWTIHQVEMDFRRSSDHQSSSYAL